MKNVIYGARVMMVVLIGALLCSCSAIEEPQPELGTIHFGTNATGLTRTLINNDNLTANGIAVCVSAVRNGSTTLYDKERLYRDATTAKWLPTTNRRQNWATGSSYEFNGFAYSTALASSSLTINSGGKQIVVSQPSSYNEDLMVDYLYSHSFKVSDGRVRPLVQLDLEHAMSLVEIRIVRHPSIGEAYLEEATISGFYRKATMSCTTPALYNSGGTNEWKVEFPADATKQTTYTRSGLDPTSNPKASCWALSDDKSSEEATILRFTAVPQQMEADNLLTVTYWVNEKFDEESEDRLVQHSETFNLYDYNPILWQPGHRIVYTMEIDTGIHLQGVIQPWVDVDYIEGTVLPDV